MTSVVAPALDPAVRKLRSIRDLASLVTYLHEELEWPIAEYDFEELVYDVTPTEAGLDTAAEAKVRSIKRLRPLSNDQPWGIFFIDFVPGDLPITVLRRILRAVSIKKRELGRADRKAWQTDDLLFISVLGEEGDRDLNLAHFNDDPAAKRATLRVVEWDAADTAFAILRTHNELKNLAWRGEGESDDDWRQRWSAAFALRPREVAETAKALASQMAALAKLIRERVNAAITIESKEGPLRELHAAFKEVLLHDLTEDGFADMYAQTMTYGLFAARQSRPMGITLDNAVDMIPNTNPFLRDLLAQFTTAAGLTHSLDFDELGVDALVEALNRANMEAVVADFGRAKQGEDPVIHFYEDFLREYNKAQKIQRGVFYTPKPVVSFIVRSVHELLQTEFQLPDGLASTDTWGDVVARFPDLTIPKGADAQTPFVQILDPACGTGTFLVEVIDVIYRTLTEKWKRQGYMALEHDGLWNEYVAKHLLPRIYGFELMMASYTISHMKVGLALAHYGYKFAAAERLRIYLTNTLEPPQDFRGMFDLMAPALAHEAHAVNEVKTNTPFTVLMGNPPYSLHSSNLNRNQRAIVDGYKSLDGVRIRERGALQFEKVLQDDYVKFIRWSELRVAAAGSGVVGFISNHAYLDVPSLRGMRRSLMTTFQSGRFVDLHGNAQRASAAPHGGLDKNVFDIRQGVAVAIMARAPWIATAWFVGDLWGTAEEKSRWLSSSSVSAERFEPVQPLPPDYPFQNGGPPDGVAAEFARFLPVPSVFSQLSAGVITARDGFATDISRDVLASRVEAFRGSVLPDADLLASFGVSAKKGWDVSRARRSLRAAGPIQDYLHPVLYRPFDYRWICYHEAIVWGRAFPTMRHMLAKANLGLIWTRPMSPNYEFSVLISDVMADQCAVGNKSAGAGVSYLAPLYLVDSASGARTPNFSPQFMKRLRKFRPRTTWDPRGDEAESMLWYVYALLWSPGYKSRYASQLKSTYPGITFTDNVNLFRSLVSLGKALAENHLLRVAPASDVAFVGRNRSVGRVAFAGDDAEMGTVNINPEARFVRVPKAAWGFEIGGYQVCRKWLDDRRKLARALTDDDIDHYKAIIGAITETIRIQKEIDEVIEAHGGWPAAFQGGEAAE